MLPWSLNEEYRIVGFAIVLPFLSLMISMLIGCVMDMVLVAGNRTSNILGAVGSI